MPISAASFEGDPHAARYVKSLVKHPTAADHLFEVLNDPAMESRLEHASECGLPALRGIAAFLEEDATIAAALLDHRFHQTVGVAVKLKMEELGWATTGKKGTLPGSKFFRQSERYVKA